MLSTISNNKICKPKLRRMKAGYIDMFDLNHQSNFDLKK